MKSLFEKTIAPDTFECDKCSGTIKKGCIFWAFKDKKFCSKCRRHVVRKELVNQENRCRM